MRSCPQCRLMLEEVDFHGRALRCCRSCGGTWIAHDDLAGVLVENRNSLAELDAVFTGIARAGAYEGLTLPCAQCAGRTLEPGPVPGVDRLTAPMCPSCGGVWVVAADRRALAVAGAPPATPAAPPVAAPEPGLAATPVVEPLPAMPEVAPPVLAIPEPPVAAPAPAVVASAPTSLPSTSFMVERPLTAEPIGSGGAGGGPGSRVLAQLMEGNRRYSASKPMQTNRSAHRRAEVASEQRPAAAVVCCSDSRVPPEIVFDQGLGDIFVVRTAGMVLGDMDEISLDFGVDHFDLPLIVILGHTGCGAIKATVDEDPRNAYAAAMVAELRPAVDTARSAHGDLVDNAGRANVQRIVAEVRRLHPIIAPRVLDGRTEVVGAYYDLVSGFVTVLPELDEDVDPSASASAFTVKLAPTAPVPIPPIVVAPEPVPPVVVAPEPQPPSATRVEPAGHLICPRCLTEYPMDATECEKCGVEVCGPEEEVPCPRCSVHNAVRAPKCRACGIDLRSPSALDAMYPLAWEDDAEPEPAQSATPGVQAAADPEDRRWCPHCRREHPASTTFCTQCGIALVRGVYLVTCGHCRSLNPISADRCRACTADLHPGTSRSAPPAIPTAPLDLRGMHVTRTGSGSAGCGTTMVVLIGVVLGIAAHVLAMLR